LLVSSGANVYKKDVTTKKKGDLIFSADKGSKITDISVTPDRKYLLLGLDTGHADVVDLSTMIRIRTFLGHCDSITCIIPGDDGYVFTASKDNTIRMWRIYNGSSYSPWALKDSFAISLIYSRKYRKLFAISNTDQFYWFKTERAFLDNTSRVSSAKCENCFNLLEDGSLTCISRMGINWIIIGTTKGKIIKWNISLNVLKKEPPFLLYENRAITKLYGIPSLRLVVCICDHHHMKIVDMLDREKIYEFGPFLHGSVSISKGAKYMATSWFNYDEYTGDENALMTCEIEIKKK
jgi:WD40 repeat protein